MSHASGGVPNEAQAVLRIVVTPAGSGEATMTPNRRTTFAPPPGMEATVRLQAEPAVEDGQFQPAELACGEKVVLAGTVSRRETAVASWSPELVTTKSQTRGLPGLPEPEARTLSMERLGEASTGVETVSQLLACGSPALELAAQAVLVIAEREAGTGEATRTVKVREAVAPAASEPRAKLQGEDPQLQPGELLSGTKLV